MKNLDEHDPHYQSQSEWEQEQIDKENEEELFLKVIIIIGIITAILIYTTR